MSEIQFIVHPTSQDLNEKIREVADKLNKYGSHTFPALSQLKVQVKQVVVGPGHLGILLEDGRALRVAYTVIPERLDLSKPEKTSANGTSSNNSKNSPASRQLARTRARIMRASSSLTARGSSSQGTSSRSAGVIIGSGSSARSLVTLPSFVPEELVSQAQGVLQGKSRAIIIRELQRTNLDVNLAVNNLLSRDDEEGEDTEEGGDNYVPEDLISLLDGGFHSDSSVIIDADAMFNEDIFSGYSNIRNLMLHSRARNERNSNTSAATNSNNDAATASSSGRGTAASSSSGSSSTSSGTGGVGTNNSSGIGGSTTNCTTHSVAGSSAAAGGASSSSTPSSSSSSSAAAAAASSALGGASSDFGRWRERQYFGPRKWFHPLRDESSWDKDDVKKKDMNSGVPLWVSDELEYWPEKDQQPLRFGMIAAMHSEFIGVTVKGELHQWRWADSDPYRNPENPNVHHPKAPTLNLLNEKIAHISAASIRCSVSTETNKIATWMDESLGYAGTKLEHAAIAYPEFSMDKIISLNSCALYTVARTESNELFWWGVLPFGQRKRLWDKFKARAKKPVRNAGASAAAGAPASSSSTNTAGGISGAASTTATTSSTTTEITVGTQVCMKNCPMYQPGAIGFTVVNGVPKVGQLLNAAWDLSNNCRFKIITMPTPLPNAGTGIANLSDIKDFLKSTNAASASGSSGMLSAAGVVMSGANNSQSSTPSKQNSASSGGGSSSTKETADRLDMPPPPSPASSTCSDTGSVSNKRVKRLAPKGEEQEAKKDEEIWQLKDVIFVEDVRSVPIGKVLKVDGAYAAVKFPSSSSSSSSSSTATAATASAKESTSKDKPEDGDAWADCRLMKKDDLQALKSATTSRVPDCFQKSPRRIVLNSQLSTENLQNSQLITFDIDTKGIHAILKTGQKLHYSVFNLNGRQEQDSIFPTDTNAFLGVAQSNVSLISTGDSISHVILLRDGNSTVYPIAKDCLDAIRDPQWSDMPPIKCVAAVPLSLNSVSAVAAAATSKTFVAMIVMVTEVQLLMSRILRCDIDGVKTILGQLENELRTHIGNVLTERIDGNRNIFHACVSMCAPTSNKDGDAVITGDQQAGSSGATSSSAGAASSSSSTSALDGLNVITGISTSNRPVSIREVMRRAIYRTIDSAAAAAVEPPPPPPSEDANSMPVVYWPPEYDPGSGEDDSLPGLNSLNKETYVSDPTERRNNALQTMSLLCDSPALQPYLKQLLSTKDAHGQTPFMLAVSIRAYQAGITLFNTIIKISNGDTAMRDSMIFPPSSHPDHSPLYVICCNDTCSFTWTGADHINQDIFECRTCGLTGSLCCCTECAKVCHKGHDCKLKKTSPTAYCDCWEKCKCKALVAGSQTKRFDLLCKLVAETDLVTRVNTRGESILLFLIQTVGRQIIEQRQYRASSRVRNSSNTRKTPSLDQTEADMPEHDLEPPRFAREALDKLLSDWASIRSMIMTGGGEQENTTQVKAQNMSQVFYEDSENQSTYLHAQSGTTLLDKFTHSLFVRCSNDPLDILLTTLVRELQNDNVAGRMDEAQKVARRFVRSVCRVFVIFSVERAHNPDKQRTSAATTRHIQAYRRVFSALHKFAVEELVEIADALIAPVRMGCVRPTMPFSLTSSSIDPLSNTDDLFAVEPMAPSSAREIGEVAGDAPVDDAERLDGDYIARIRVRLRDVDENNDNDAAIQDDGETSEQDETEPAQNNAEQLRNDDAAGENESDNEFTFNEAETESDSDDNQSTQDAQRSVQTGATAGSDTDDTNDSSQIDDEGSDDNDSDDRSQEDLVFGEEQLERRTGSSGSQRNNLAPPSMQWAIRTRDTTRGSSGVRLTSSSNVVFIDPNALRRTTTTNPAAVAASQEPPTMATTASSLARAFGIVLRQISELITSLPDVISNASTGNHYLYMTYGEAVQLQMYVERRLRPTLEWILTVMDSTEAQLRFGGSLTDSADPSHPLHPLNTPPNNTQASSSTNNTSSSGSALVIGSDGASSRRDFLTYCLSLMRAHNSEHRDSLPVLDITALKHVAYVLDALIYYMRSGNEIEVEKNDASPWDDPDENENEDAEDEQASSIAMETDEEDIDLSRPSLGRKHPFFQRSSSTLCLGCSPPDPFHTPLSDALPLADQPHLLTPNSRREELFAMPKSQSVATQPLVGAVAATSRTEDDSNLFLEYPPVRLGLAQQIRVQEDIPMPELPPMVVTSGGCTNTMDVDGDNDATESEKRGSGGAENVVKKNEERAVSPRPGPSREASAGGGGETEVYFKKTRHYYQKAEKEQQQQQQQLENSRKLAQVEDEPQDLSANAVVSNATSMKMDIDDMSDSSDSAELFRSDRPPIIITRKKLSDALQYATTSLAKNKKGNTGTLMAECERQKVSMDTTSAPNDFELPNELLDFSDDEQSSSLPPASLATTSASGKGAVQKIVNGSSGGGTGTTASGNSNSNSPGKSVIVRAGPSNSTEVIPQVETMETQEICAHVTVETTPTVQQTMMTPELPIRGAYFRERTGKVITSDFLLRRWQVSLILFGRVFLEDVGMEPGSIISELGGFPVKETKFRRHMEKLRNAQQRDMTLSKMERNRASLITQTFKELNSLYNNNNRRIQPPLAYGRVKVTFKDEPGEGSGVARSFYTSIAEALLANEKLPNLEAAQVGSSKYSTPFTSMLQRHRSSSTGRDASSNSVSNSIYSTIAPRRTLTITSPGGGNSASGGTTASGSSSSSAGGGGGGPTSSSGKPMLWRSREQRRQLSYEARPFRPTGSDSAATGAASYGGSSSSSGGSGGGGNNEHLTLHQQQLGERLYPKVAALHPKDAPKITGMLLELPSTQLLMIIGSEETLRQRISEALKIISQRQKRDPDTADQKKLNPVVMLEPFHLDDNAPLFYSPGKRGFYSPRQGGVSFERLNAFRNVGRLIGLCLLQNELLPLFLQRHVLKYILGRQVRFHDLAFFDPTVYESLRQLVKDSQIRSGNGMLASLDLTFIIDLCPEEGGGTIELIPGGREIQVTEANLYDYVRKYAEYRMLKTQEKALESIRAGVFDVLPETALATLTAEDLRLLLNGVGDIHVNTLISYTTFNDESNESSEKIVKFKRWLWSVVEKMSNLERQDLVYFWTGSPALPASEDGFQPMPSVTIRPSDDHLPTANTCISRLYIPLYPSRAILRHKLLLAIKTKNFGFV